MPTSKDTSGNVTPLGGFFVRLINGTGSPCVKGQLVACSTTADNEFVTELNTFDTIGVCYDSGIANGKPCRIVISGVAEVRWKANTASRRGYVALSHTDGTAYDTLEPTTVPSQAMHFKEIGHVLEEKAAPGEGLHNLVKCVLHFN